MCECRTRTPCHIASPAAAQHRQTDRTLRQDSCRASSKSVAKSDRTALYRGRLRGSDPMVCAPFAVFSSVMCCVRASIPSACRRSRESCFAWRGETGGCVCWRRSCACAMSDVQDHKIIISIPRSPKKRKYPRQVLTVQAPG